MHGRLHALDVRESLWPAVYHNDGVVIHCPTYVDGDTLHSVNPPRRLAHVLVHAHNVSSASVTDLVGGWRNPRNLAIFQAQAKVLLGHDPFRDG